MDNAYKFNFLIRDSIFFLFVNNPIIVIIVIFCKIIQIVIIIIIDKIIALIHAKIIRVINHLFVKNNSFMTC